MSDLMLRWEKRTYTGTEAELERRLRPLLDAGRIDRTRMTWWDKGAGLVEVTVYVLVPFSSRYVPPATSPAPPLHPSGRAVLAVLAAIVALTVAGYVLYLVTADAVVSALRAAVGVLLAVALLTPVWLLLGRAGVCCPGLHCPGCRHH